MKLFAVLLVSLAAVSCLPADGVDLLAAIRSGHPRIKPTSRTVVVTETVVRTERLRSTVCAKLINVTASCRLPNERELVDGEEPVVLTFDDGMDQYDSVDALAHIRPSDVLVVETTVAPTDFDEAKDVKYRLEASFPETDDEERKFKSTLFQGTIIYKETVRVTTVVVLPPRETKTVFFMNCTPSPFTAMPLCLSKKRNVD